MLTEDSADMRINQKQNIESDKLRTERNLKVYLKKIQKVYLKQAFQSMNGLNVSLKCCMVPFHFADLGCDRSKAPKFPS